MGYEFRVSFCRYRIAGLGFLITGSGSRVSGFEGKVGLGELPWRKAGLLKHLDEVVDSDQ